MGKAKDIRVRPIAARDARRIIGDLHYSGKTTANSQIHLGVFLGGRCGGALQFGPSMDKRKLQGLVRGTKWNEFIELNRMALADWLPRNGESRAIGFSMRWLRKTYPWLQWVVSFADGAQCGDGTIYRASGFVLTGIKRNDQVWEAPNGERFFRSSLTGPNSKKQQRRAVDVAGGVCRILDTGAASMAGFREAGWRALPGFQLRYVYFLDPSARDRLTAPVLPFSEIERLGAGMYRGKSRAGSIDSDAPGDQPGKGGATPTSALQSSAQ